MQQIFSLVFLSLAAIPIFAADNSTTNESTAAQEERLFQRILKDMRNSLTNAPTNFDSSFLTNFDSPSARVLFQMAVVDPSFGYYWNEVPAPTLIGSNAMLAVNAFVATNGWNMQTNDCIFDCILDNDDAARSKPIRGLPWTVIQEQEFPAVTHDGILYVFFRGFHHDGHGVAYNPNTNRFAATIDAFKPIGQHWYAWMFEHESPLEAPQPQIYEGSNQLKETASLPK
jgi:hypothetical protein